MLGSVDDNNITNNRNKWETVNGMFRVELRCFDRVNRGARITRVTMSTAQYLATRKILKKIKN
jgi:hypothetical protein